MIMIHLKVSIRHQRRMAHLRQHIHHIGIESEVGTLQNPKCIQLMPKSLLPDCKLSGIGSIQTINAVGSRDAVLKLGTVPVAWMIIVSCWTAVKEFGKLNRLFSDVFQDANDILILAAMLVTYVGEYPLLGRSSHIPRYVAHLLVLWQELIQVLNALPVLVQQL